MFVRSSGFRKLLISAACMLWAWPGLLRAETPSGPGAEGKKKEALVSPCAGVLFEDDMTGDWKENWFLDGEKATLQNRETGLYFAGGTVTKEADPKEYHAHHATLWTKQVFEGDIRISYEVTRNDTSDYGNILLYIQAQGTGKGVHDQDILHWKDLRSVPAMDLYFKNMNLISLSFRENLRCKRYPWFDSNGKPYPGGGLIEPMVEYIGMIPGKAYRVDVEKRADSVRLQLSDAETGKIYADQTWDTTKIAQEIEPKQVLKGRIGLRHMSTKQSTYKDFRVERL